MGVLKNQEKKNINLFFKKYTKGTQQKATSHYTKESWVDLGSLLNWLSNTLSLSEDEGKILFFAFVFLEKQGVQVFVTD